jgi:hypothetical protein
MSKKPIDTAADCEAAEEHLQRAYSRVVAASIDLREKRKTLSNAIMDWQSHFRVTPEQATRDHLRRTREHEAAARLLNKPADVAAPMWPIQQALTAGKSPNANVNLRRPRPHLLGRR